MTAMAKLASDVREIRIESQSRDGRRFFLSCPCGDEFSQPRSSITVECPSCGNTAMMIDLALDYRCGRHVA